MGGFNPFPSCQQSYKIISMGKNLLKTFVFIFTVSQIGAQLHTWFHPIENTQEHSKSALGLVVDEREQGSEDKPNHSDCRFFHFSERTDFHLDVPHLKITLLDKILSDLSGEPERFSLKPTKREGQPRAPPQHS